MFSDNYIRLCKEKGIGVTVASQEIGYSANSGKKWSEGSTPRKTTLLKIAEYFGVTVDELLADNKKAAAPKDNGKDVEDLIRLYQAAPAWLQDQVRSVLEAGAHAVGNLPDTDSKAE